MKINKHQSGLFPSPVSKCEKPSSRVKIWEDLPNFPFIKIAMPVIGVISMTIVGIIIWRWFGIAISLWAIAVWIAISYLFTVILLHCLKFLLCLASYPHRRRKMEQILNGLCLPEYRGGTILGVYVCKESSLCDIGRHDWHGCKCKRCGKTRDESHEWDGCKCKCCGKTRDESHYWDGCTCKRCGVTRDEQHNWINADITESVYVGDEGGGYTEDWILRTPKYESVVVGSERRCSRCGARPKETTPI